ncbi:MAG: choice-of-anchor Q domain-containing protein, partial [Chromatiales bacterium]
LDTATPAPNVISSTLIGDYHLDVGSPAIDVADAQASTDYTAELGVDFDGDLRPQGNGFDIGADEVK